MQSGLAPVIEPLKRIAKENNLSAQRIYKLIEDAGDHVSLNTIKKFLADGSEYESFNYYQSIEPIERVLRAMAPATEEQLDRIAMLENYIQFLQEQIKVKDAQLNAVLKILG